MRGPRPVRPSRIVAANAGGAAVVSYNSVDDELNAVELSALRWRYDDLTNAVQLQDWASVADPDARGTITVSAALNAMTRDWRDRQLNQVTFELTDTSGNVRQQLAYVELANVYQGS